MIYEIKNISFSYPGGGKKVLKDASFTLGEGEVLSILGPNGAGKTTLLNCMAGLLNPDEGKISLCGVEMGNMTKRDIAKAVSYVPQIHVPAFNYRVLDFVMLGCAPGIGLFGRPGRDETELCMKVMEDLQISDLMYRSYMDISGGERQQVMIARALVQKPKVILFDEPTAHLDFGNQHKVLKMIRKMAHKGYSTVITTHNPDHALLLKGRTAIVESDGRIVSGNTEDIITEEKLRQVYDIDLCLLSIEKLQRTVCLPPELEQ